MAIHRSTHPIGVFFLFAASILLLMVTISAPVVHDLGLLRVTLTNQTQIRHSSVSFGTFGYCILDVPPDNTDQDYCTKSHIGYDPANVMARIDYSLHPSSTSFSEIAAGTSDSLTRVMILHPIACGLAFIAFLLSLGAGVVGSLAGFFVGFIAWILTVIVLATDFTVFGIVRHHVNNDGSGSHAYFGIAIWLLVAAFVVLFFGMFIVLFTCCSARRERKRSAVSKHEADGPTGQRRKRFGLF